MVIPTLFFPLRREEEGSSREGIRCKTGAVPATVIAFCVQRTKRHWGLPLGRRAAGQKPGNLPFRKNKTILGIKDEKTPNPL